MVWLRCAEGGRRVIDCLSDDLVSLLEGLLQFDPQHRTMLGESGCMGDSSRQSIWDAPWFHTSAR
eukprot:6052481-Amphidinium_carterae.1